MSGGLKKSSQTTSGDSRNATSSLALEDGPMPCDSPIGPMIAPSGPAPVPVSRFRGRDREQAMPINDTCGPLFTTSSPSANLQWSLESRLLANLVVSGMRPYVLIWKHWDMPAGVPICALRWLGRDTSGHVCSMWPTPTASDTTVRQLGNPVLTRNGTWRHKSKAGPQSATRLTQVANHLGRPDLAASGQFRAWMMGYPETWSRCVPTETASSPKSRQRSSKPT
jgi:hypothetical protein